MDKGAQRIVVVAIVFVVALALFLVGVHITLDEVRHPAYATCLEIIDYVDIAVGDCIQYADANYSSTVRDYIDYLNNEKSSLPERLLDKRLG